MKKNTKKKENIKKHKKKRPTDHSENICENQNLDSEQFATPRNLPLPIVIPRI